MIFSHVSEIFKPKFLLEFNTILARQAGFSGVPGKVKEKRVDSVEKNILVCEENKAIQEFKEEEL